MTKFKSIKYPITIIFALFANIPIYANMAEPVIHGTEFGSPFLSKYVDIINENIKIEIDENFQYAKFDIEYYINSSKKGIKIPILFYSYDLSDDFKIEIDGNNVELKRIPYDIEIPLSKKFVDFSHLFGSSKNDDTNNSRKFETNFNHFKYFETDIAKGYHRIKVSYTAEKWTDGWDWINEYSFRYELSPAKYWKSFGNLSIVIDGTKWNKELNTNIENQLNLNTNGVTELKFDKLPVETFKILYKPQINKVAKTLIKIKPFGLSIAIGLALIIIHLFSMKSYRKKNPHKKISWAMFIGSIIVPLLFFISWQFFFSFIDMFIGEHASQRHGYGSVLIAIIFLPLTLPIYWLVMWQIDRILLKKEKRF